LIHDKGISIPGIKMLLDLTPCWEITKCPAEKREQCKAFIDRSIPCWQRASTACAKELKQCEGCEVYVQAMKKAREAASGECLKAGGKTAAH
jgi:MerR family transcriptional regulator/heat shock protein HspR